MSSPIKVAIIEDDFCNRKYLEMVVKKMDYQPVEISDLSCVLEDLNRERPHLVLLDIKLSETISGIDIARSMKQSELLNNVPIIVVSAFALNNEVQEIKAKTRCNDYIVKPFSIDRLEDSINEQLCGVYGN